MQADLRAWAGEIEQAGPGPCVAAAVVAALELVAAREGRAVDLDWRALYDATLAFERWPYDGIWFAGDALWIAATAGVAGEEGFTARLTEFYRLPTPADYAERQPHWLSVPSLGDRIKAALDAGDPVVLSLRTGTLYPSLAGEQLYPAIGPGNEFFGNHTATVIGYDADTFLLENSRGPAWGDHGFWWLDSSHLVDVYEAWVVSGVEIEPAPRAPGVYLDSTDPLTINVVTDALVWIGATWQGGLYLRTPDGWHAYGGELYAYSAGSATLIEDVTGYDGAQVYVATGTSPADWTVVGVCTIGESI